MQTSRKPRRIAWKYIVPIIVALIGAVSVIAAALLKGQTVILVPNSTPPTLHAPVTVAVPVNAHSSPTPTLLSMPNPYPPYSGVQVINNSMQGSTPDWEESHNSTDPGTCKFSEGVYLAMQPQPRYFTTCTDGIENFSDFAFEIRMMIVRGDCGGIIFDSNDMGSFYYFRICESNGAYVLDISKNNSFATTITSGVSSSFMAGLEQVNTLGLVAQNGNFAIYVNNQRLFSTSDPQQTYDHGYIGVLADSFSLATEVAFSDVRVWAL